MGIQFIVLDWNSTEKRKYSISPRVKRNSDYIRKPNNEQSYMNRKQLWYEETNKNKMKTQAQMQMILSVYSSVSQIWYILPSQIWYILPSQIWYYYLSKLILPSQIWYILESPEKLEKNTNKQFTHPVSNWVKSLNPVGLFATPWTVAYQYPPSMGFSR